MLIWGTAVAAYVVAVAGRTSLGVAGLQATEHFSISASTLATFSVVQLAVYAAAQIPGGILLDQIGSRRLIVTGAVILAVGQLMLGLVHTVPLALVARVLIGLGDAMTLISVMRLIPVWFRPRLVPIFTQLTGILGQLGQLISAVPFLAILITAGWTAAFATLAGTGLLVGAAVALAVRDRPASAEGPPPPGTDPLATAPAPAGSSLRAVIHEPGAWLGFFTHFITLFPANTFLLLWGVPFLTAGQGFTTAGVSALLTISVVAGIIIGPIMGDLVARYPARRSWIVLGTVAVSTAVWSAVLLPSGPLPFWQLVPLAIVVAAGVCACTIGFDFARTSVRPAHLGTAIGMVNVGGYLATLTAVLILGFVLDAVRPSGEYELLDFRFAFAAQAPLLALGVVGLLVARHLTRRRAAEQNARRLDPSVSEEA